MSPNAQRLAAWLREHNTTVNAAAGVLGVGHNTLRRIMRVPDYEPGMRVVKRCEAHGLYLDGVLTYAERHEQQREELEAQYPSADGWMWGEEFRKLTGVPSKVRGLSWRNWSWERVANKGGARYRITSTSLSVANEEASCCRGCARKLTPNRTYIVDGLRICMPCHRRIFLQHDRKFAASIGVMV